MVLVDRGSFRYSKWNYSFDDFKTIVRRLYDSMNEECLLNNEEGYEIVQYDQIFTNLIGVEEQCHLRETPPALEKECFKVYFFSESSAENEGGAEQNQEEEHTVLKWLKIRLRTVKFHHQLNPIEQVMLLGLYIR